MNLSWNPAAIGTPKPVFFDMQGAGGHIVSECGACESSSLCCAEIGQIGREIYQGQFRNLGVLSVFCLPIRT